MKIQSLVGGFIVFLLFVITPAIGFSQISSTASSVVPTEYGGGAQDNIHVFCGQKGQTNAALTATNANGLPATFEWLKYDPVTGNFNPYMSDASGAATSVITNLSDGAYRVNITTTAGVQTYTAWVFNNYIETTAAITNSDCNSFTLAGTSDTPALVYYDLTNRQAKTLAKNPQVSWTTGNESVGQFLTNQVFSPPTKDTEYTLKVTDRFGCSSSSMVQYVSIVTKASFTAEIVETKSHPTKKEAPLTVTFRNTSENGDKDKFHWFIYKSSEELSKERAASPNTPLDSIMEHLYVESPTYIFERPGTYNVKLVSQKTSASNTCYDTVYIDQLIKIDTSFIEAPNFFTPGNNDQVNDQFIVRFFSMKSVKISIFNRWGKVVHVWESNDVKGFGPTIASIPQAVWDGKVGGKLATPGVYYYVVEGRGRDDKKRQATGFFHLFRDK
ncbi:MAG: gliding motility-associated C-terminal domain-containing protein [Candidatus Saccharibacteria bacterium]